MHQQETSKLFKNNAQANPPEHQQPAQSFAGKIGKVLVLGVALHLLLTLSSFLVIYFKKPYAGPMLPHLPIYAGEILYARMPPQYWEHRILMLKGMGINALSTYVIWNFHELSRGNFDFNTGWRNLTGFLELAKRHKMRVLLRPGPYVCAEWDFGGLPPRLLGLDSITIRSNDPIYIEEVRLYFSALAKVILPYLYAQGGPIVMLQIDNQLGYLNSSPEHTLTLMNMWRDLGVQSEFYYEDSGELWESNYWPGAHLAVSETSGLLKYLQLQLSGKLDPDSLVFGGEVYAGWFTDWGQGWQRRSAKSYADSVASLLAHNRSFNIFVAFGGTNFGTHAGANGFNPLYAYIPHQTSYDEDAPVSEHGHATEKYKELRKVLQGYHEVPDPLPLGNIQSISIQFVGSLFSNLPSATVSKGSLTFFESNIMQMYNQGIVLYETTLPEATTYTFQLVIRDFALLFIDDSFICSFLRGLTQIHKVVVECTAPPCKLRMVVEAMGHVNFGRGQIRDRKGLISFEEKGRKAQYLWDIYKFQLDSIPLQWSKVGSGPTYPSLFRGVIEVRTAGDIFLDVSGWGKGYVWVNGHNLGRFWAIGPQHRLYCPGVWLKQGSNDITVLQLTGSSAFINAFNSMV